MQILIIAIWLLIGVSGWRVCSRAGLSGYIGFLFLIPILNLFALLYLAYAKWPIRSRDQK